ncbi:MAG: long-chain-fatty-acid--CoA ligase [Symbiobacteriia bacterium]
MESAMESLQNRPWSKHYPTGVPVDLPIPEIPLYQFLDDAVREYPQRVATIFKGGQITYHRLDELTNRFAHALQDLGVEPGDRVALMLPNCPQMVIAFYGALRAGAIVVMTNPLYVERELEHQLNDSGSKVIVVLDLLKPRVEAVRGLTALRHVIYTSIKDFLPFPLNLLYPLKQKLPQIETSETTHRWPELIGRTSPGFRPVKSDPNGVALLQYTGGTTGVSKGAMLTHKNLIANTLQTAAWMGKQDARRDHTRILSALPFFHVYGLTVVMNLAVALAGTMLLMPKFEVGEALKLIEKYKPSLFPGAPTMYVAIINHPDVAKRDLSSIESCISGSAPLPLEVQNSFERITHGRLVEGYGLTEASPVTHSNPLGEGRKNGTIGLPFPNTDMKIVDLETGDKVLGFNEVGELCVKGPQVMMGYWNRPEETARALRDGWLYTGDIAQMDEDGYTSIVDRKKDMIIAGGFNIYPREVEEILFQHPAVQEAVAVGVPDAYRGETVKAYLVLKQGQQATQDEIIAFCRDRMAKFKAPTAVEFRTDLPKTIVGKVLRRRLLEEEKERAANAAAKTAAGAGQDAANGK